MILSQFEEQYGIGGVRMASASAYRLPALILCSVKNSKLRLAEPLLKLHLVARHRSNPQKPRVCSCFVPHLNS